MNEHRPAAVLLTGFVSADFAVPFVSLLATRNFIPSAGDKTIQENQKCQDEDNMFTEMLF